MTSRHGHRPISRPERALGSDARPRPLQRKCPRWQRRRYCRARASRTQLARVRRYRRARRANAPPETRRRLPPTKWCGRRLACHQSADASHEPHRPLPFRRRLHRLGARHLALEGEPRRHIVAVHFPFFLTSYSLGNSLERCGWPPT